MPRSVVLAQCLIVGILILGISHFGILRNIDFTAFYCGAKLAAAHQDPYRAAALMACELPHYNVHLPSPNHALVIPVPFPGAYFFLLAPLTWLPYEAAAQSWGVLIACCFAANVYLLQKLSRLGYVASALTLLPLGWLIPSLLGQPTPCILTLLLLAAHAMQSGRHALASCALSIMLVEPHLGIPACLGAFCSEKRMRIPLIAGACIFALVSVLYLGVDQSRAYLSTVVPAQAIAEIIFDDQMSFGAQLGIFGLAPEVAVRAGECAFFLSLIGVTWAAQGLARRSNSPAITVLAGPACTLFYGPYLHIEHCIVAIPLLAILLRLYKARIHKNILLTIAALVAYPSNLFGSIFAQVRGVQVHSIDLHRSLSESIYASELWGAAIRIAESEIRDHRTPMLWRMPTMLALAALPFVLLHAARTVTPVAAQEPSPEK